MPKEEDDFWANQKEGLRYCSKHKCIIEITLDVSFAGWKNIRRKRLLKTQVISQE